MRSLSLTALCVALLAVVNHADAQLTPVTVQMHAEGHATVTPPIGPPQSQNAFGDLSTLGETVQFAPAGDFNFGPYAYGSGGAAVKLFGAGYRFVTLSATAGRPAGGSTTSSGAADATFVFNIDQACTISMTMNFVVNAPTPLAGNSSTFFEFYGPGDSLIYDMHVSVPTNVTINQSFDLMPGLYRMRSESFSAFQSQGLSTALTGWSCQSVIDFTVPAPGCLPLLGALMLHSRRRRF